MYTFAYTYMPNMQTGAHKKNDTCYISMGGQHYKE